MMDIKITIGEVLAWLGSNMDLVLARAEKLEEVANGAREIYLVAKNSQHMCPHGNSASFPSHVWYCDECFSRLEDALGALEEE